MDSTTDKNCCAVFRVESKRLLNAMMSEQKMFSETETEEQQKLKNKSMEQRRDSEASVCRIHEHEEEARAPLMGVTSDHYA